MPIMVYSISNIIHPTTPNSHYLTSFYLLIATIALMPIIVYWFWCMHPLTSLTSDRTTQTAYLVTLVLDWTIINIDPNYKRHMPISNDNIFDLYLKNFVFIRINSRAVYSHLCNR